MAQFPESRYLISEIDISAKNACMVANFCMSWFLAFTPGCDNLASLLIIYSKKTNMRELTNRLKVFVRLMLPSTVLQQTQNLMCDAL